MPGRCRVIQFSALHITPLAQSPAVSMYIGETSLVLYDGSIRNHADSREAYHDAIDTARMSLPRRFRGEDWENQEQTPIHYPPSLPLSSSVSSIYFSCTLYCLRSSSLQSLQPEHSAFNTASLRLAFDPFLLAYRQSSIDSIIASATWRQ